MHLAQSHATMRKPTVRSRIAVEILIFPLNYALQSKWEEQSRIVYTIGFSVSCLISIYLFVYTHFQNQRTFITIKPVYCSGGPCSPSCLFLSVFRIWFHFQQLHHRFLQGQCCIPIIYLFPFFIYFYFSLLFFYLVSSPFKFKKCYSHKL